MKLREPILALSVAVFFPSVSLSATLTWDTQPAIPGPQGGSDNWHDDNHWLTGASNVDWNNTADDDAVFTGTGGDVNLNGINVFANSLTFSSNGYRITNNASAGTLRASVGESLTLSVASGVSAEIAVDVEGFTKTGAGTLTLTDGQFQGGVTGAVTVSAGTLRVDEVNTVGITVNSGATLALEGTGQVQVVGSLVANGTVTVESANVTGTLSGSGDITVDTQLNASLNFTGNISGSGILRSSGGTLGGNNTIANFSISSTGGITTLSTATSLSSNTSVTLFGGGISLGADIAISGLISTPNDGQVQLNARTLTVQSGDFDGVISGTGSLRKTSAGTLALTGTANSFSGLLDVFVGTVEAATLANSGVNSSIGAGTSISLGNGAGNGTLAYTGTAAASSNRSIALVSGNANAGGGLDVRDAAATLTWSGAISGAGPFRKLGPGTLTLAGNNAFTGEIRIQGGKLRITGPTAFATPGLVTLTNAAGVELELANDAAINGLAGGGTAGGHLDLGGFTLADTQSTETTFSGALSGPAGSSFTKLGAARLTLAGDASGFAGQTVVNAGILRLANADGLVAGSGITLANVAGVVLEAGATTKIPRLTGGGVNGGNIALGNFGLTLFQDGNSSYGGAISGSSTSAVLAKTGTGTLTLTGTSSFTNPVLISGGALSIAALGNSGVSGGLGQGNTISLDTGTLRYTGGDTASNRELFLFPSGGEIDITGSTSDVVWNGPINGSSSPLTKRGVGSFKPENAVDFSGPLTVENGAWIAETWGNANTTSSIGRGVTLFLGESGVTTTGVLSYIGPTATTNRALRIEGRGAVDIIAGSTLTLTATLGLAGFGETFSKRGTGTMVLASAGEFAGDVFVDDGTLRLTHILGLDAVGKIEFTTNAGTNARLDLGDVPTGAFALSNLQGGTATNSVVQLNAENAILRSTADATYAGLITGSAASGTLRKEGVGRLALNGVNSFAQALTIADGALIVGIIGDSGAPGPLGVGPVFTLGGAATRGTLATGAVVQATNRAWSVAAGGGTFDLSNGADLTLNGAVSGAGALFKTGAGRLVLAADNSLTGPTTIQFGAIRLAQAGALDNSALITIDPGTQLTLATDAAVIAVTGAGRLELDNSALTLTGAPDRTFAGVVTGTNGAKTFTKRGSGTLTLTNTTSSFAQAAAIEEGAISIASLGNAGLNGPLGAGVAISLGALGTQGRLSYTGTSTSSNRAITLNLGGGVIEVTNAASGVAFSGAINGPGGLVKQGLGNITLTATSNFTGDVIIQNGTVFTGAFGNSGVSGPLGSGDLIALAPGTKLAISGATTSNRTIFIGGGGTIENGIPVTLSTGLAGSGEFIKLGGSPLILTGSSTFTGIASVDGGTLRLAKNDALASAEGVEFNGLGTLELTTDSFVKWLQSSVFLGAVNLNSSTLSLAGTTSGAEPFFGGAMSGTGGLLKLGPGSLALTGMSSSFSGGVAVKDGTLGITSLADVGTNSSLGAGGTITLGDTSTVGHLRYAGPATSTNRPFVLASGGGRFSVANSAVTVAFTAPITGSGGLRISSGGGLSSGVTFAAENTFAGSLIIESGFAQLDHPRAIAAASSVFVEAGSALQLSQSSTIPLLAGPGFVFLGTSTLTVDFATTSLFPGTIAGSAGSALVKRGLGSLALSGANSFAGLSVESGVIEVADVANSGTIQALGNGASATLGGPVTTGRLRFTGVAASDSTNRNIVLGAGGGEIEVVNNTNLTLSGAFSGTGGLAKFGLGRLTLSAVASSFAGNIRLARGTLAFPSLSDGGLPSPLGAGSTLTIGDTGEIGTLAYIGAGASASDRAIVLQGSGGTVSVEGGAGSSLTLSGSISGSASLAKTNSGRLTLSGASSFTGSLAIITGELRFNGSLTAGGGDVTLSSASSATLSGTGTIARSVNIGSASLLAPGVPTGSLQTRSLAFSSNGGLSLALNSASGFSRVNVTGSVSLASATPLTLTLGYDPQDFVDSFLVVQNDGVDAITGRLAVGANVIEEGERFLAGGQEWQLSYVGGDGNDVALLAVPEPSAFALICVGALFGLRRRRAN